jgi:hypothetical protein
MKHFVFVLLTVAFCCAGSFAQQKGVVWDPSFQSVSRRVTYEAVPLSMIDYKDHASGFKIVEDTMSIEGIVHLVCTLTTTDSGLSLLSRSRPNWVFTRNGFVTIRLREDYWYVYFILPTLFIPMRSGARVFSMKE